MTPLSEEQKLKAKALNALAKREHSRFELKQKLAQISPDHALIDCILDHMIEQDWLSDMRFANAFLAARAQRHYGPRKIRYELQQRGVTEALIEQAFAHCTLDWQALAEQARQRKFGAAKTTDWIEQAKQKQYLYQRGFDAF